MLCGLYVSMQVEDVAVAVELAVDGGGVDGHVGVAGVQGADALGGGEQAEEFDGAGAVGLEPGDGGDGGVAGGEHKIDDDDVALGHTGGHLVVVLDGLQGLRVAVQADVAFAGVGHDAAQPGAQAQAGAQDGGEDEFFAVDDGAGDALERGVDFFQPGGHVAGDFVGHEHGQLIEQGAEGGGAGVLLAHERELVLHHGVGDVVNLGRGGVGHGRWGQIRR